MSTTPLFPLPEGLEMTSISETSEELLVYVTSHRSSSPCPQGSTPSAAIHSSYCRHPRDLPCIGRPIRLVFTVRKFFCRNPSCSRKVFDFSAARFHCSLLSPDQAAAHIRARHRVCHLRQGRRTSG